MDWIDIKKAPPTIPGEYFTFGPEGYDCQYYRSTSIKKWGLGHGKIVTHWAIPVPPIRVEEIIYIEE